MSLFFVIHHDENICLALDHPQCERWCSYYTKYMNKKAPLSTLVKLRHELGLSQSEFADLIKSQAKNFPGTPKATISLDTVKALECGRLQLSEGMAYRIAESTGICLIWLSENKSSAPMVAYTGSEWRKEEWARIPKKKVSPPDYQIEYMKADARYRVAGVSHFLWASIAACSDDPIKRQLALFRLARFTKEMIREFGMDQETYEKGVSIFNKEKAIYEKAHKSWWNKIKSAASKKLKGIKIQVFKSLPDGFTVKVTKAEEKRILARLQAELDSKQLKS